MATVVIFDIEFSNGIGQADVVVFKNGDIITQFSFTKTGSHVEELAGGVYAVAVTGNSQGAEFIMSVPSTPRTPNSFPAGIIAKAYVLNL